MKYLTFFLHKIYKNLPLLMIITLVGVIFVGDVQAAECKTLKEYQEQYNDCYACLTIKLMLESFMIAASRTYNITSEGGVTLLVIGAFLWVALFVIKKISSFTNPEGPKMVNELLVFAFKVLVAYVGIKAGITVLVDYFINPVLATGADLANTYLSFGLPSPENAEGMTYSYVYKGPSSVIDPAVIDKILAFTEGVSRKVANNMVIGNGIMCNSLDYYTLWELSIPNIWLWFCGACIWVVGFCLVLFVSYYLLDIAFKIGIAIIMLPIAIGLWPFKPTKGRVGVCFSIILRAAATYALLAICATFSTVLVDEVLKVEELFAYFEADQVHKLGEIFNITKSKFLVFCIAFLYAIRLVGKNETLANKLFPDKLFNGVAPIHSKLTGATSLVTGKAMKPFALGRDIITHQTGRMIKGGGKALASGVGSAGKFIAGKTMSKFNAGITKK